jgi:cytochrome c oxidase assembly factor CtaG
MRLAAGCLLWLLTSAPLSAHVLEGLVAPRALSPFDWAVILFLAVIGVLYAIGVHRRGSTQLRRETLAFAAGWTTLMLAVLPPIDALALQLFSAHMAQHELMMLVGAPLVMAGRPMPVWLAALHLRLKRQAVAALQSRAIAGTWRLLTTPLVAWTLHGAAIWLWHLPAAYDLAVDNEAVHLVQHASFVGTSTLFWWGMLYGRYGRIGYGAAVFYVFTTAIHTGILGAMVTFAGSPLYSVYLKPAAVRGIDSVAGPAGCGPHHVGSCRIHPHRAWDRSLCRLAGRSRAPRPDDIVAAHESKRSLIRRIRQILAPR